VETNGSPFFEIAIVLVRLDHVASVIVNANHGIMGASGCSWRKRHFTAAGLRRLGWRFNHWRRRLTSWPIAKLRFNNVGAAVGRLVTRTQKPPEVD